MLKHIRYFSVAIGDIVSSGSPARIIIAYMSYSGQGEIFYCDHYTNAKIAGYDLLARDSGNGAPVRNASSNVVYGLEIMSTV